MNKQKNELLSDTFSLPDACLKCTSIYRKIKLEILNDQDLEGKRVSLFIVSSSK